MRLILLVMVAVLGVDAYFYSGAYTQSTVATISRGVQKLASNIDVPSERPTPPRPIPDRTAG